MRDEQTHLNRELAELEQLLGDNLDLSDEWQQAVSAEIAWCRARLAAIRSRPASERRVDAPVDRRPYS